MIHNNMVYTKIKGTPVHAEIIESYHEELYYSDTCNVYPRYIINIMEVLELPKEHNHTSNKMLIGTEWGVDRVEPIASDLFKVGDIVRSILGNQISQFKVTGYEPQSNRVICLSLGRNEGERSRYAYKVYELETLSTEKSNTSITESPFINVKLGDIIKLISNGKILKYVVTPDKITNYTSFKYLENTVRLIPLEGLNIGSPIVIPYSNVMKGILRVDLKSMGYGFIRKIDRG